MVDLQIIKVWMNNVGLRGARMHYFRPEKNVSAGPISTSKLRIYCIRCTDHIVILGGGGVKKGQKTQDGEETSKAMNLMIEVDKALIAKIKRQEIYYSHDFTSLQGELYIEI